MPIKITPPACLPLAGGTLTGPLILSAGSTSNKPLQFQSGALLTSPVAGVMEFLTDAFYGTITTGAARRTFAMLETANTFTAAQTINLNAAALPAAITGTSFRLGGADGTGLIAGFESFAQSSVIVGRRANGTAASPSTLASGNLITGITARGYYGTTGYSAGSVTDVLMWANENWTDTAQGSYGTLRATPNTTTSIAETARWDGVGFKIATGKTLQLGNVRAAGALVPGGSVTMVDGAGTTITVLTT